MKEKEDETHMTMIDIGLQALSYSHILSNTV